MSGTLIYPPLHFCPFYMQDAPFEPSLADTLALQRLGVLLALCHSQQLVTVECSANAE